MRTGASAVLKLVGLRHIQVGVMFQTLNMERSFDNIPSRIMCSSGKVPPEHLLVKLTYNRLPRETTQILVLQGALENSIKAQSNKMGEKESQMSLQLICVYRCRSMK